MERRLIGFLSDFGMADYYVAAVKGVIYSMCPEAEVVDITHEISSWGVGEACYVLSCCYRDFPPGTVFLAVVDPGVGTSRKPIVIESGGYFFVGPDNGLLTCVVPKPYRAWEIVRVPGGPRKTSYTFHGRDIFAPVAAFLACRGKVEEIGEEYAGPVEGALPEPLVEDDKFLAEVLHIDKFGNAALNIKESHLASLGAPSELVLDMGEGEVRIPFRRTFGEVPAGNLVAYIDSCGYLEIAVNQGSAAKKLKLKPGMRVGVKFFSATNTH
jgi:S-adenosylmethionine hydrolase